MIAVAKTSPTTVQNCRPMQPTHSVSNRKVPAWHRGYLRLLPAICRQARIRLRHLRHEARDDAFQEIVADTVVTYARLAELGKEDLAYPTPMVNYAVAKLRAGRRVGNRLNVCDITSKYCQRRKKIVVQRLDHSNDIFDEWQEMLVEDRNASPADVATIRIDFHEWLKTLPIRTRLIAEILATGESTCNVAQMFAVSASRISQIRQSLRSSWYLFIGESSGMDSTICGFA